jgi:hypothetical protein
MRAFRTSLFEETFKNKKIKNYSIIKIMLTKGKEEKRGGGGHYLKFTPYNKNKNPKLCSCQQ